MQTGTVRFYNEEKGFGYITPDSGEKDLFVHISGIESGVIRDGDRVQYQVEQGKRGPCAVSVKRL